MSLDQVQAEVENLADQFVLQVTETTNQIGRAHPEAAPRLHWLKLSVAKGAFIIASGPNPVVSLLDLVVQATLLHHIIQRVAGQDLPEDAVAQLIATFERSRASAWSLAERVLTAQELTDLRGLIDTWIEENPNTTYVAGVRFSDFARMRPKRGSKSPTTLFGLLHVDPFASIDPAAREMHESRLLAERMFFYVQRAPQMLTWHVESLYHDLARAPQSQQVLTNLNDFTATSKQLNETIAQLPTRTREELANSEQTVTNLLNQMNQSLDRATQTLAQADQSAASLREVSQAVVDAGKAWEATATAMGETAAILNPPKPPGAPDQPPSEPVTIHDVTAALQEAQSTAVEMRKLLDAFTSAAQEGGVVASVNESVIQARRSATDLVITATVCVAALIVMTFVCAIIYRATGGRVAAPHSGQRT